MCVVKNVLQWIVNIFVVLIPLKDIIHSINCSDINISQPLVIDLVCNCSPALNAIYENIDIVIAKYGLTCIREVHGSNSSEYLIK
jgi:hypothetical protein